MADCLTPAEIEGLLADTLSPADKARAEAHLAACEKCRQEVERGQADNELFGKIKRAYQHETLSKRDQPIKSHSRPTPPTESIEGYEILSEVHRGGQGVVYKAVQKATKRTVALKVLLEGPYASPRQRHRFEREIDLVASLQHPNIVTVYDSGVTRDGRHFFAMEYIHGQPLDAYLSDKNLSIDETLRLFQKICAAVNHAHQHGVIHRDLKPGNIRVDASGEPHVLDFGLAKAGAGGLTPDGAPVTVTGEFMGTLAYASPEQTKGDPTLVDIRTDVYSLGVILYEMLTGKYPYQVVGQMADVLKNIAEAEPKKPSTIRRQINDEVETIVLKSLAKDKERRYQSAENLGRDIEHYLSGQPIDAKRDSGWYVLRKTLRRYRAPATAAAGYLVIVTVALLACVTLWRQATEQRDRAVIAEQEQSRERQLAETARAEAEHARAAEAEQRHLVESERDRAVQAEQAARELIRVADLANINGAAAALSANQGLLLRRHLHAVSPDSRNWEWRYLSAAADTSAAVLQGHGNTIRSVVFSPDGSRLASASSDKTLRIWDVASRECLIVLKGHADNVNAVSFSPDGKRLASASRDKTIRLWDATTGQQLAVLEGHKVCVRSVAFSPDGMRLATGSGGDDGMPDNTVRLWDATTGKELAVLSGHQDWVSSVAFSPDGRRLASASDDETVRVWDSATGQNVTILRGHEHFVNCVTFSPDGTLVASGSPDRTVRVWEVAAGRELRILRGHDRDIQSVAFSPDGTLLASGSLDTTVGLWETATGKRVATFLGNEGWVTSVAFSPDGTRLASASTTSDDRPESDAIHLWDVSSLEEGGVLRGHESCFSSVAFSPDGTRLASGSWPCGTTGENGVYLWDTATAEELAVLRGHDEEVWGVAFSPDGLVVASASGDKSIRLWDTGTGEELGVLRGHEDGVRDVVFSPDGSRLASASDDKTVRLWDSATGQEVGILRGHESGVRSVAISPSGTLLASGSEDKTVRLWDVSTNREIKTLRAHEEMVRSVAFIPDGSRLASASRDGTVRLWDAHSGTELAVFRGFEAPLISVACGPDGTRLALGANAPGAVHIRDVSSGQEMALLKGHQHHVFSVAFSPDGTILASGSSDETVRLWDSVPYYLRFPVRQAILAARPEAERIIDGLLQKLSSWKSVAQQLRADTMLSEPVRRAALNEVLRRAAASGKTNPPGSRPSLQAASKPATQSAEALQPATP